PKRECPKNLVVTRSDTVADARDDRGHGRERLCAAARGRGGLRGAGARNDHRPGRRQMELRGLARADRRGRRDAPSRGGPDRRAGGVPRRTDDQRQSRDAGRRTPVGAAAAVLTALAVLLLLASAASAATFTVTKTEDTADGKCDADCSLREAIIAANATPAADQIVVPAGTYQLTIKGPEEDAAATGDLDLTEPVEVLGAGARTTIVRGDGTDRVFDVRAEGAATIAGMTIEGGRGVEQGAGIDTNSGTTSFTLRDAAVVNNQTSDPEEVTARQGAGVFLNAGHSTIERVLVSGNVAASIKGDGFAPQGAGIFINEVATLTNDTITGNTIEQGGGSFGDQGGGIFVNETATMTNVTISNNKMD